MEATTKKWVHKEKWTIKTLFTSSLGLILYRILSAFSLSCRLSMIASSSLDALFWTGEKERMAVIESTQSRLKPDGEGNKIVQLRPMTVLRQIGRMPPAEKAIILSGPNPKPGCGCFLSFTQRWSFVLHSPSAPAPGPFASSQVGWCR